MKWLPKISELLTETCMITDHKQGKVWQRLMIQVEKEMLPTVRDSVVLQEFKICLVNWM